MRGEEWNCWSENTQRARRSPSKNVEAARLENAVWRLWNMERLDSQDRDGSPSPSASLPGCPSKESMVSDAPVPPTCSPQRSMSISRLNSLSNLAMAAVAEGEARNGEGEEVESGAVFKERVQGVLGQRMDFANLKFPAARKECRYDDLPTFPIRPNFAGFDNALRPASECVVFDGCPDDPYHPSNTPIYQTATFVQPSSSEFGPYDYTRSGNPTRTALEKHAAMLEKAAAAFAFASGMAALHTVMRLLKYGDELLLNEDIYGGMHRLVTQDCVHNGITVAFCDTTDVASVEKMITPRTKLIHTESPSNPRMRISDLRALAEVAHKHGVLLSVDSTMMPPVICKPLALGADIVVHSATKFFSGHADCTGGLVCVRDPQLAHRIAFLQNAEGTALAPFECFLFLRGIKTMHLRVTRAQESAEQVANFLLQHPMVKTVSFPGKGGCDPERLAIHRSQALGQGSMISLTTGSVEFSRRFCDACRIFKTTVSFGSVNSLCEMPCTMSHASIPTEKRTLAEDLVRLSIGIEDPRDLIADLAHALDVAAGIPPGAPTPKFFDGYDSRFEDLPVLPKLPSSQPQRPMSSGTPTRDPGSDASNISLHTSPAPSAVEEHLEGSCSTQPLSNRQAAAIGAGAAFAVASLVALVLSKRRA